MPDATTGSLPAIDAAAEAAAEAALDSRPGGGAATRSAWNSRVRASVADPVLRVLVLSTLIGRVGRGIFLSVTVLYFTLVVGLSPLQVAVMMAASSALGVVSSGVAGHLADRLSARRMLMVCMIVEGVGLGGYVFTTTFPFALALACVVGVFDSAGNATRMAIVARAFEGGARVNARAILRTVTNIAIGVGAAIGGLALLLNTPTAYRVVMVAAAVVFLAGTGILRRLPRRVDAAPRERADGAEKARRQSASPWRDARYLAVTALSAIFGMQFGLAEIGVPLWIAHDTAAPTVVVSVLLILNTIIVIVFQVPLSRGTHDVRRAGTVTGWAGILMAAACVLYLAASGQMVIAAIALLVAAAIAHAFAEVMSQAGGWGLSFELADPRAPGAYQGVFGMGFNLGSMLAPILITAAIAAGTGGWLVLAVVFLLSAFGTTAIAWRASRRHPASATA
ncbi:MFS transporter [Rathayibacter sp. YIM 133350]|uniref:MFS transporter n=1 Tax=Rathayibacter sp. YIM 133350 TaxID=3131992 RepID=UPI00307EDF18